MTTWSREEMPDQSGKLTIVTGGNSSIGFETAKALANAREQVIVAARSEQRGQEAVRAIKEASPTAKVEVGVLDLANLASIAMFAQRLRERGQPIDLLINNAGVMAIPQRRLTRDGFEMHFGTNHLGHFALTGHLFPLLLQSRAPRVVTVSAVIARWRSTRLDLADLQSEQHYRRMGAYASSKLANVLFAIELDRRARGTGLISVAVHPGASFTNLQQHAVPPFLRPVVRPLHNGLLGLPAAQCALPSLYAATASEVSGGTFFGPTGRYAARGTPGAPRKERLPERALDENLARALWEVSERLTQVHFSLLSETNATKG